MSQFYASGSDWQHDQHHHRQHHRHHHNHNQEKDHEPKYLHNSKPKGEIKIEMSGQFCTLLWCFFRGKVCSGFLDFALLRAIIGVQQISLLTFIAELHYFGWKKKNYFVQFVAVHRNPCHPVLPFPSWSFAPIPIPPPSDSCNRYFPFSPILQHIISPSPLYPSSNLHQLFGILHFASITDSRSPLNWTWLIYRINFYQAKTSLPMFCLFSCWLFCK